jgi:chromate reductase
VFRTLRADLWMGGRLMVARAGAVFDASGDLVDDKVRDALRTFLADFVAHAGRRR